MKKIYFLIIIVISSCTTIKYKYVEKNLHFYNQTDTLTEGMCIILFNDSTQIMLSNVIDEQLNGNVQIYDFLNDYIIKGCYKNGKKVRNWFFYNKDSEIQKIFYYYHNQPLHIITFKNGKRNKTIISTPDM